MSTTEKFEFAAFDVTSTEWDAKSKQVKNVVNPSSDNGRAAWDGLSEDEDK